MATNLVAHINFNSSEWHAIRRWLQEQRDTEVQKLISSKQHDESMRIRGAINKLDMLLNAEKDALIASRQGHE